MSTTIPTTHLSTDAALARLVDEAAIRDATARFADAATRGDIGGFRAMWADDAVFDIGDRVHAVGVDDIESTFRGLREGRELFVQFAVQGSIHIDGDEARTSCIVHEAARGPGETYYRNHCIANDRLRRASDGWVFTHRAFLYLWLDTSPFSGANVSLPAAYTTG